MIRLLTTSATLVAPFYSKTLTSETDYKAYAQEYNSLVEYPLPIDFLQSAHVRGFFVFGKMVGGYVINKGPEFRSLKFIPEEQYNLALSKLSCKLEECIEICAYWMLPRTKTWMRPILYTWMLSEVLLSGRSRIISATTVEKVKNIHSRAGLNDMIYQGNLLLNGKKENYWVYYGDIRKFLVKTTFSILRLFVKIKPNTKSL